MIGIKNRGNLPTNVLDEFEWLAAQLRGIFTVEHNEDGTHRAEPEGTSAVPVGAMLDWGSATPPTAWLICDGSQVDRLSYQALFNVIGTTYGAGDGSTTFNIPDFRGRFALSKAAAGTGSALAGTGGSIDHTHTTPNHSHAAGTLAGPSHTHAAGTLAGPSHSHGGATGSENINDDLEYTTTNVDDNADGVVQSVVRGDTGISIDPASHSHTISADGTGSVTGSTGAEGTGAVTGSTASDGSGTSGTGNPPYLVINKIIYAGRA